MSHIFMTKNREYKHGVQGVEWLYVPTPLLIYYVWWLDEENGGYEVLRSVDNALLYTCFALAIFAFVMGATVL